MSELDYTETERPAEPLFANLDPEGWCEVSAWEQARADRLEEENEELRALLRQHHEFCKEVVHGYESLNMHKEAKELLNK